MKLTNKGRVQTMLDALKDDKNHNWDGKWRIVVFDIPEKNRTIRELFRNRLKEWNFVRWQRSVWVSKSSVTEVLREYIKFLGIADWVLVFESDNVGTIPFYGDRSK